MGTQLSYGGSGAAPWEDAAGDTAVLDAAVSGDGSQPAEGDASDGNGAPGDSSEDDTVESLITNIIQAIEGQDRRPIPGAPTSYTPTSVRPSGYMGGAVFAAGPASSSAHPGQGAVPASPPRAERQQSPPVPPSLAATPEHCASWGSTSNSFAR